MKNLKLVLTSITIVLFAFASCSNQPEQDKESRASKATAFDTNKYATEEHHLSILVNQLEDYLSAFTSGDVEKAIYYLYPDMFIWMQKTGLAYGENYSLKDVKKMYKESVDEMKIMQKEQKLEFTWIVEPLEKIAESADTLIVIALTSLKAIQGYNEFKLGDENICISFDGGENWKFLANDEESAPDILRMKFGEDVVRKITDRY